MSNGYYNNDYYACASAWGGNGVRAVVGSQSRDVDAWLWKTAPVVKEKGSICSYDLDFEEDLGGTEVKGDDSWWKEIINVKYKSEEEDYKLHVENPQPDCVPQGAALTVPIADVTHIDFNSDGYDPVLGKQVRSEEDEDGVVATFLRCYNDGEGKVACDLHDWEVPDHDYTSACVNSRMLDSDEGAGRCHFCYPSTEGIPICKEPCVRGILYGEVFAGPCYLCGEADCQRDGKVHVRGNPLLVELFLKERQGAEVEFIQMCDDCISVGIRPKKGKAGCCGECHEVLSGADILVLRLGDQNVAVSPVVDSHWCVDCPAPRLMQIGFESKSAKDPDFVCCVDCYKVGRKTKRHYTLSYPHCDFCGVSIDVSNVKMYNYGCEERLIGGWSIRGHNKYAVHYGRTPYRSTCCFKMCGEVFNRHYDPEEENRGGLRCCIPHPRRCYYGKTQCPGAIMYLINRFPGIYPTQGMSGRHSVVCSECRGYEAVLERTYQGKEQSFCLCCAMTRRLRREGYEDYLEENFRWRPGYSKYEGVFKTLYSSYNVKARWWRIRDETPCGCPLGRHDGRLVEMRSRMRRKDFNKRSYNDPMDLDSD